MQRANWECEGTSTNKVTLDEWGRRTSRWVFLFHSSVHSLEVHPKVFFRGSLAGQAIVAPIRDQLGNIPLDWFFPPFLLHYSHRPYSDSLKFLLPINYLQAIPVSSSAFWENLGYLLCVSPLTYYPIFLENSRYSPFPNTLFSEKWHMFMDRSLEYICHIFLLWYCRDFQQGTRASLLSVGAGSVNSLRSGTEVRDHNFPQQQMKSEFCFPASFLP